MSVLNYMIASSVCGGLIAISIMIAAILRRALQTGVLKKGQYFMGGSWSRDKNPVAFRFWWGLGAFSSLGLFAFGASSFIANTAIFLGY